MKEDPKLRKLRLELRDERQARKTMAEIAIAREDKLKGTKDALGFAIDQIASLTAERDALKANLKATSELFDAALSDYNREKSRAEAAEEALRRLREAASALARNADKVTDCVAEFSIEIDGKCLCVACGEHLDHLDSARERLEKALAATAPADGAGEGKADV